MNGHTDGTVDCAGRSLAPPAGAATLGATNAGATAPGETVSGRGDSMCAATDASPKAPGAPPTTFHRRLRGRLAAGAAATTTGTFTRGSGAGSITATQPVPVGTGAGVTALGGLTR